MLAAVMDNGNILVHNYKWGTTQSFLHSSLVFTQEKTKTTINTIMLFLCDIVNQESWNVNLPHFHQEEREKMNPLGDRG